MTSATVNQEQRLYVIPAGHGGYSCLGFDYAEKRRQEVLSWIGKPSFNVPARGTLEHYAAYQEAMQLGAEHARRTGTRCSVELSPQLNGLEGKRVEVVTMYDEKRRFWVGKSTGWMPCHLEIHNSRSTGGPSADHEYKSVRVVNSGPRHA